MFGKSSKKARVAMQKEAVRARARELATAKQRGWNVEKAKADLERAERFLKEEEAKPDE
jgi:N-acetyl-beta-hexosaminidase